MFCVLIVIVFLVEAFSASEPQCSRFHYEEKTLEKMIKLEIFVQKIKDDISAIEKRVTDTLRNLRNEKEGTKIGIRTTMNRTIEELKENERTITAELQKVLNAFKNITGSIDKPKVAFTVKSPTDLELSVSETVIYKDITFNEGNGYDHTTGIFTALATGTYIFSLQFCTKLGDGLGYAVMSKERELKRGYMKDSDGNYCHNAEAVDILEKGDCVLIECTESFILIESTYQSNTLSGVLVHHL